MAESWICKWALCCLHGMLYVLCPCFCLMKGCLQKIVLLFYVLFLFYMVQFFCHQLGIHYMNYDLSVVIPIISCVIPASCYKGCLPLSRCRHVLQTCIYGSMVRSARLCIRQISSCVSGASTVFWHTIIHVLSPIGTMYFLSHTIFLHLSRWHKVCYRWKTWRVWHQGENKSSSSNVILGISVPVSFHL